jgi:hypothetical protein
MHNFIYFSPYLNAGKRELLADYALPVTVIIMSLFGAIAFKDVTSKYKGSENCKLKKLSERFC